MFYDNDASVFIKDFGQIISIILSDNTELIKDSDGNPLKGIFDDPALKAQAGNTYIQSDVPTLEILSKDITTVKVNDTAVINNINYNICFINDDGTGFTVLDLVKC